MRFTSMLAIAFLSMTGIAMADQDQAAARKTTNIGAQGLAPALQLFAKERDIQVVYRSELVGDRETGGASGEFTVEEALTRLLSGTGLTFRFLGDNGITIVPVSGDVKYNKKAEDEGRSARNLQNCSGLTANKRDASKSNGCRSQNSQENLALARADETEGMVPVQANDGESSLNSDLTGNVQIEEIIVTAQRREQNLQEVPLSISVLSGEALDQSTGDGVLDALQRVAGVAVTPGANTGSTISIRGVGPTFISFFNASPTGYYLDSVPFGFIKAAFVPDMGAYDLERVEVLRGPQGTLYGASSVGGLVRVLSKDANLNSTEFKFRSSLSQMQYGGLNYGGDAAVNVPIVKDVIAARLVAGYHDLSGWIDQPNTGRKDVNDGVNKTLRFKINAQPTDALSLELSTWFSRNKDGAPTLANDSRQYLTNIDETQTSDFDLHAFDLGYDFGAFSFTSATSYLTYEFFTISDNGNPPTGAVRGTNRQSADVFSQAFQLASTTDGPWRWTAGAIYRHVEDRIFQIIRNPTGAPCCGYVAPADETNFSDSYAAFGELTRTFLDSRFELTGGLRYFHDKIYGRQDSAATGAPPSGKGRSRTFEKVSPRIVASWLPTKHFTAYASYSEGFRSGVDQYLIVTAVDPNVPDAQPDNLRNYEIGFKGDVLDGRLSFDAAAYYMDWQDVQTATIVFVAGVPAAAIFNGPSASGPGIDLGLTARPTNRLTFGANVGWNNLTFDEPVIVSFGPNINSTVFNKGDRLNLSPEITAGAWVDYKVPLSGNGHVLRFGASANHTSERYQRLFGQEGPAFVNGPMTIVAARMTLETPSNWSFTLFGDNLTNEQTPISGLDPTGRDDGGLRMRPRTVGIQLQYRY